MGLKIIGSVTCPIDSGHTVSAGISREGLGNAVHIICAPCSYNLQAKRASPLGHRLVEEARGAPTTFAAPDDAPQTHADEPETTEVPEDEPEREPARMRARTEDVV